MSSNGNRSDTASFTVNFSLPRETIREYFDGVARVEAAKRPTSSLISSDTLSTAWTLLTPFVIQYLAKQMNFDDKGPSRPSSGKVTEADLKNLMANFQDGRLGRSDSDSDDDSDIDSLITPVDQTEAPVSTTNTECEVDITREPHSGQIRTIINMLGLFGTKDEGVTTDEEVLDHAISALQYIRANPEQGSDKHSESTTKGKGKDKAKKCCVDGVCATGSCEAAEVTRVRTGINLLSTFGFVKEDALDDKEALNRAISTLKFIRDNPEGKPAKSKGKEKKEKKEKKCCIDDVCATGACEVVKDDKMPDVASTASNAEDSFQPDLKTPTKKSKIVIKPKYQPEENASVLNLPDMAKNMFTMFGIDEHSEQSKLVQQLASGLMTGLQNGNDVGSIFGMVANHVEKEAKKEDAKDTKDDVKSIFNVLSQYVDKESKKEDAKSTFDGLAKHVAKEGVEDKNDKESKVSK